MRHCGKKIISLLLLITFLTMSVETMAATMYLPDVTADMAKASWWIAREAEPDQVLASPQEIRQINKDIVAGKDTGVMDLEDWTARNSTFDGIQAGKDLVNSGKNDAADCFENGAVFKGDTTYANLNEAMDPVTGLYGPMIANCTDPAATTSMPVLYAVCTKRTTLRSFPSPQPLYDDINDADFDYQYLSAVSVGEPMILRGKSADGKYYAARTSYTSGWVAASDIALFDSREAWLAAWNFKEDDEILVVYDDKIVTEDSYSTPETANRRLSMGTRLKIADRSQWTGRISNRLAYNNYVVWMPVRDGEGKAKMQLALISEHCKVSEGYLPLTTANLAKVIFNMLGNTYGWGGMLSAQDCSGYVRVVYQCFGLELARNTTEQTIQPVKKYNLEGKTDAEKADLIRKLPLGSTLLFSSHTMFYLGCVNDKLYVISSVSKLYVDGKQYKVRGTAINTLDVTRSGGEKWLSELHTAEIPYYNAQSTSISSAVIKKMADQTYTGKAISPEPEVSLGGTALKKNVHYTLSYKNNTEVGTATVTVTGKGNYSGSVNGSFRIKEADKTVAIENLKPAYVYSGKVITPAVKVTMDGKTLKSSQYKLTWAPGRKKVGTYKVSVTLKGRYKGTASKSFKIIPKGTSITKVARGKQSFKVYWKKQKSKMNTQRVTGYQIQYATNKKFTRGMELAAAKKYSSSSKKISQLRKKKKYYVRIRTYMTVSKKNYYSKWSTIKTVKTR